MKIKKPSKKQTNETFIALAMFATVLLPFFISRVIALYHQVHHHHR